VPDRVYDSVWGLSSTKRKARATAIVVHELGHVLHEASNPRLYWNLKYQGADNRQQAPSGLITPLVSAYVMAQQNWLEFVAETFTAKVYGETMPGAVNDEYAAWSGP